MKKVQMYIENVREEVRDAMDYAEKYVIFKNTRPQFAKMYHDMAENELTHAENLRMIGQTMMNEFSYVPEADVEDWTNCGKYVAEQSAIVRLMLSK